MKANPPDPRAAPGAQRIREAAIELFKTRGYHGTSIRDLAQAVQMEAASLYYHYRSKQDILADLLGRTMDDLIAGFDRSVDDVAGAEARLRSVIRFHVAFHVERQCEAFVSHSELRALTPENLSGVIAKRDRYEGRLRDLLAAGIDEGVFEIADLGVASTAILMMCSGVSDWFVRSGRLSGDVIGEVYADMVLKLVAAPPARGRR